MASPNVIAMLRSKGAPYSDEELANLSDAEGWKWIYGNQPPKLRHPKPKGTEVCFTGFRDEERATLEAEALAVGVVVKTSVTKTLAVLVTGETPGPSKVEKARNQGAAILNAEEFRQMLATGEVSVAPTKAT